MKLPSSIRRMIKTHLREEDGSANAEWVVIVASVVGLAAVSTASISGAIDVLSSDIGTSVSGKQVTAES
ncbi:hypothetical protein [Roseovarius sp.]|uniref:Flp family type IVb pilin n=1 Tax=Roseovarius sp. TaxID=1486281 RepID=UPI0026247333|nr:hypothetical protein [Roseovarius sp.]MDM8168598.1 hypothetical protein [Roseovarius sp.]